MTFTGGLISFTFGAIKRGIIFQTSHINQRLCKGIIVNSVVVVFFANTHILKALHLFDGYIKVREEACIDFSPVFYSEAGHPKHENICIYLFSTISSYLKTSYITIVSVESIAVVRPEGWSPSAKRSLELFGHSQREMVVVLCG